MRTRFRVCAVLIMGLPILVWTQKAPGEPLAKGPGGALAKDTAVFEIELPPEAKVTIDGAEVTKRRWTYKPFQPGQRIELDVVVRFGSGKEERRKVLLQGGWQVRLVFAAVSSQPELVFQVGHGQDIGWVTFSPDGKNLVTAGQDQTVIVWDAMSGRILRRFQNAGAAALGPGGRQVLIAELAGTSAELSKVIGASVYDLATGRKLRSFPGHKRAVSSVAYNGKHVVTGSWDNTAILWDAATGKQIHTLRHGNWVEAVALSPDGKQVLTGSLDNSAILWDVHTGRKLRTFPHGKEAKFVYGVAFSPDGKQILTGSDQAILWDAESGRIRRTFSGHGNWVHMVVFSRDGKQVLTGSMDRDLFLWDLESGQKIRTFSSKKQGILGSAAGAFSPDGTKMLTAFRDSALLWDTRTGKRIRTFQGSTKRVQAVAFRPHSQQFLGTWNNKAILWDGPNGRIARVLSHEGEIRGAAFSVDGQRLVTGALDNKVILWELNTGQKLRTFDGQPKLENKTANEGEEKSIINVINAVCLSPGGTKVLSAGISAILWDVRSGRKLHTLEGGGFVASAAFRHDGWQILTGHYGSDKTFLWDTDSGQQLRSFRGHIATFAPDGQQALTGAWENAATLWDVSSGRKLRSYQAADGPLRALTFSPDGTMVLGGAFDNSALLWDRDSGREVRRFIQQGSVQAVAFSEDGRFVLTGSAEGTANSYVQEQGDLVEHYRYWPGDGTVRLWDIATGQELCRLIMIEDGTDWAVVTPEGLFDGSRRGREQVFFRLGKGLDLVPLDRFFQDFYYPGLLAAIWRGERPMPGKPFNLSTAPTVKILVNRAEQGEHNQVIVDVAVTDQGGGFLGPWLQHNGAGRKSGKLLKKNDNTSHYRFPLALVAGDNRIEVRAATVDGSVESEPAMTTVKFDGKLPEPELYVLAIGINRFAKDSGISNLEYCVPDARAVADLFQKRSGKLFKQVHVTALYDEQASKEGILKAVTALAGKARAQDTLVLYVASHGIAVGQRFYLIPHDFKLAKGGPPSEKPKDTTVALRGYRNTSDEREAAVRAHGLAIDELGEALASVPALKRVLIFDTCHSGSAIALAGKRQDPFAFRGAMERFSRAQGVYSLSATAADELAAENRELGHSILTYALLAGLQAVETGPLAGQAVKSGRDGVDVLEWFRFARQHVPALYQRYLGRPQQIELSGEDQPSFLLLTLKPR